MHVSTDEVYGSIEDGAWPETHPVEPNSPYSASKAGSDLLARAYARTYGLDVRITRCSNNYGPYQFPEKVIPLFVTNLLDGGEVPLYGDGSNVRDWLHVDDHCRGIQLVVERGRAGEIYNIGGGTELTNRRLTELLLEACGADWSRVRQVPDRLGHDRRYSVDISKISAELGYAPCTDFETGLRDHRAVVPGQPGLVGTAQAAAPRSTGCPGDPLAGHRGRRDARPRRDRRPGRAEVTAPTRPRSTSPTSTGVHRRGARPRRRRQLRGLDGGRRRRVP